MISPKDRSRVKAPDGYYFICVYGKYTSSYSLIINEDDDILTLKDGVAETLSLQDNEVEWFVFQDKSLSEDIEIKF